MALSDFTLCPRFQKSFKILGKKWNGLIIEVLLQNGAQRFSEIAQKIPEISDRVLGERLKELENEGIVEKKNIENYVSYELSPKGADLKSIIKDIHIWADKWS